MTEISNFIGDGNNRTATVYKDKEGFYVTVKNASGVYFTSRHESINLAEDYAEDWILKDE